MSKISFIGSGNMGSAIISGIISSGLCSPSDITATDVSRTALDSLSDTLRIATTTDNAEAAKKADILFLSVKPNVFSKVIPEIKESVSENTLIISIAAGMSISDIEKLFAKEIKLIRVMPNLNATVGEAMSALCPNKKVDADSLDMAKKIFESIGECEVVDEHLMDAVVAVSGSSPAYAFMFIEALADAAVCEGMPRIQAYKFAAQSLLGSAKLVLESGRHPADLKDAVCSPAGTTIEAVAVLEKEGFRNAIIDAARACAKKNREM